MAPNPIFQAARWIKAFHRADYRHIGWLDHGPETDLAELLIKYGFVRVARFELNAARLLMESRGPLLARGAFYHSGEHESPIFVPGIALTGVNVFAGRDHAIVLNGYWDGPKPRLLYFDPAYPLRQFVCELDRFCSRLHQPLFYLNCVGSPCPHGAEKAK